MKKLRSLLFLLLALCCLTVSVSAFELTVDPTIESDIEAEISEFPSILHPNAAVASYGLESRASSGFMLPSDTAYGATFVKDTTAKVSFIVEGCRSDEYIYAALIDDNGKIYAQYKKKLSEINANEEEQHLVTLPFDLKECKVPLGNHFIAFGIIDKNGYPVYGALDTLDFTVVSREIPLSSVSFYDAVSGYDVTEITVCPDEVWLLGLIYTPENATGTRNVVYTSSDEKLFTVKNFGGYASIEPVKAGTGTLTATVNGKVTATLTVKVGHDYVLISTDKTPTCTEKGKSTYQCSYCDGIAQLDTLALGHDYGSNTPSASTAPTACKPGSTTIFCDRCKKDITSKIPAIFSDTVENSYYMDSVDYFYQNGYIQGIGNGCFGTTFNLNRGMLLTLLYRMAGEPETTATTPFTDVPSDLYFSKPIAWAYENNIAKGITETTFEPLTDVTRQQLATFIYRYAAYRHVDLSGSADLSSFRDVGELHTYAQATVSWAVSAGIIKGNTDNYGRVILDPLGPALRPQTITMLYHYLNYEVKHPAADPTTPDDSGAVG